MADSRKSAATGKKDQMKACTALKRTSGWTWKRKMDKGMQELSKRREETEITLTSRKPVWQRPQQAKPWIGQRDG
jgi:hypothetical protein